MKKKNSTKTARLSKDPRGRKSKIHKSIDLSFDQVLGTIGGSKKKTRTERKKR